MIRINAYNLLYDFRDFVRNNRGKIIIITLINILVIFLGIRGAFAIYDPHAYLCSHASNVFSFLIGDKGVFGYFITEAIACLMFVLVFTFASIHFIAAYVSLLILFFRTYLFVLYTCLYIMFFKLAVLPFVLACLIPFYLAETIIFTVLIIQAINHAHDARCYGVPCGRPREILCSAIPPCIMIVILTIFNAMASYFLTLGIIL